MSFRNSRVTDYIIISSGLVFLLIMTWGRWGNLLVEHEIEYIDIVTRPTPEYGYPHLGRDYGKTLLSWIRSSYTLEKLIGPWPIASPDFGVAIFRKKTG